MIYAHFYNPKKDEDKKMTDEFYNELIKRLNKAIQENEYLKAENKALRDENIRLDDEHNYYYSKLQKLADLVEDLLDE